MLSRPDTRWITYLGLLTCILWGYYISTRYTVVLVLAILVSLALCGSALRTRRKRERFQTHTPRSKFRRVVLVLLTFEGGFLLKHSSLWRGLMPPFADVAPGEDDRSAMADLLQKTLPYYCSPTDHTVEFLFDLDWMGLGVSCFRTAVPFRVVKSLMSAGYSFLSPLLAAKDSQEKARLAQKVLTVYRECNAIPIGYITSTFVKKQAKPDTKSVEIQLIFPPNLSRILQLECFLRLASRISLPRRWRHVPQAS